MHANAGSSPRSSRRLHAVSCGLDTEPGTIHPDSPACEAATCRVEARWTSAAHGFGLIGAADDGLLALLLGFSFAAAGGRFLERQDLILQEANAIGTAVLRADLLAEPQRSDLRAALKRYTEVRLAASANLRHGIDPAQQAEMERLQGDFWRAAALGVADRPATTLAVLNPVNEVIDLYSTRLAAARKHLPGPVMGLLLVCSMLAIGVIGYGCGIGRRRHAPMTVPLALLIGFALWITIDLDYPRNGFIQLNDAPLEELRFDSH